MPSIDELRSYYTATLPYYDLSIEDRGDLPFWESMARRWSARRILELGCGTGRVTAVLSAHANTTAVDVLIEMLHRAHRRVPAARVVAADLREIAFTATFDLVILADDPIAHLTSSAERMAALQRIAAHLDPQGRLVLEGLYRPQGKEPRSPARAILRDGVQQFTVSETWTHAEGRGLWNAVYRYDTGSAVTEVSALLRAWEPEEIGRLPELGLEVESVWGDFDERPFSRDAARVLIVARRA